MSSQQIDPRGPQFNAAITSVVLLVVLLTAPAAFGIGLLALQAALFALGAIAGPRRTPAAFLFRRFVRPRLQPPLALEDAAAPRFAQGVGLGFALAGLVGYAAGIAWVGPIAVGLALVAALLNATLRFCLGCQLYGVCKVKNVNIDESHKKEEALV